MTGVTAFASLLLAAASPIIFVTQIGDQEGRVARPMSKELIGHSVAQINDFRKRQDTSQRYSGDFCYLEAMRKDALVSANRQTQEQIDDLWEYVPGANFDMSTPQGIRLTIGIFEKCQVDMPDEARTGSLLVASRAGQILWISEDALLPLFLLPARNNALAVLAGCLACGNVAELYYDPANRKFYTEYVGD